MKRSQQTTCILSISLVVSFLIVGIVPAAPSCKGPCACAHQALSPCCTELPVRPTHLAGPAFCPLEGTRSHETGEREERGLHQGGPLSPPGKGPGAPLPNCRLSNPDHPVAVQGPAAPSGPVRSGLSLFTPFHSEAPDLGAQTLAAPAFPAHEGARAAPPPAYLVIASFRC